jgi:hypothetical protein
MKIFILWISMLTFILSSTAQTKLTKTLDFKYAFSYNTVVQHYDLELYSIREQAAPVHFLQIWTGNEYRDLSACNYSIDSVLDHQMIPITKKSPLNLIGKPPIRFKGHILLAYRVNGKTKHIVLNNPQISHIKLRTNRNVAAPPYPPCFYGLPHEQY